MSKKVKKRARQAAALPAVITPKTAAKVWTAFADVGDEVPRIAHQIGGDATDIFRPYRPMPGVLPTEAVAAMDSGTVSADGYGYGFASNPALFAMLSQVQADGIGFHGYTRLSQMAQRSEYRDPVEIYAKEATREWIRLTITGKTPKPGAQSPVAEKADRLQLIEKEFKRLKVREVFRRAYEHDGFFGMAHVLTDIKGKSRQVPLVISPKTIKVGSLIGFRTIEPYWTSPYQYDTLDPTGPDFYRPQLWYVMGKPIHASWLMTMVSRPVPDILKPAYNFGGIPLIQLGEPYVQNWLRARQSVSDILSNFSKTKILTNLAQAMQEEGLASIMARVAAFVAMQANNGVMLLDKDTEDMANVSSPLGTLDKLQAQSQEQMAAVYKVPLVKLLRITPTGLNPTAEGEMDAFNDDIMAYNEHMARDPITRVLEIVQLNLDGVIDPDIDFSFVPLHQMTEKERAELETARSGAATAYINAGVVAPEEDRERLSNDEDGMYAGVDLSGPPPEPPAMQLGALGLDGSDDDEPGKPGGPTKPKSGD